MTRRVKVINHKSIEGTLTPSVTFADIEVTLHKGKMGRLKHKCLITIVSLLECNIRSKEFVTKIMRTIPLTLLTDNLARIYYLF